MAAEGSEGEESESPIDASPTGFEGSSPSELKSLLHDSSERLRQFFGQGKEGCEYREVNFDLPVDLTLNDIGVYREIVHRKYADRDMPTVQVLRLKLLHRAASVLRGENV